MLWIQLHYKKSKNFILSCGVEVKRLLKITTKHFQEMPKYALRRDFGYFSNRKSSIHKEEVSRKKVTNANSGQSIHNYDLAVDICLIIDRKSANWDTVKDCDSDWIADWNECVKIFSQYGWELGVSWKTFKDLPHVQKKEYGNWRTLQNLTKDKDGYPIVQPLKPKT